MTPAPSDALDVAIVGGGVSGLYAAWRLSSAMPRTRIALFERSGRIGGRLRSLPAAPGAPSPELGGIGFLDWHQAVKRLCAHLELKLIVPSEFREVVHLRGRSLSGAAVRRSLWAKPFDFAVPRRQQRRSPSRLIHFAAEALLPGATELDQDGWREARRVATFGGRRLNEWPLHAALSQVLDFEALSFMEATLGGSYFVRTSSGAVDMLEWLLAHFGGTRKVWRLADGYQSLPQSLARSFEAGGGTIRLGHGVSRVDRTDDGFTLALGPTGGENALHSVQARRVILALPKLPAQIILEESEFGRRHPDLLDRLASVEAWPIVTFALQFPEALGMPKGFEVSASVSDLPIRQIWHYAEARTLVFASDGEASKFWTDLAHDLERDDQGFCRLDPDGGLAGELLRQARLVYGKVRPAPLARPIAGWMQDWSGPSFGGGIHFWALGSDRDFVRTHLLRPIPGLDFHVCGEAWCDNQGWVEGALINVEMLLQREFGLSPPDWLADAGS
jgi:predicted NAD/FAD-dependent oxidoreductase